MDCWISPPSSPIIPTRTTDADVEQLRTLGWTDPQIAEAVYITALFAFFNRVANAFGLADPGYLLRPRRPGRPSR